MKIFETLNKILFFKEYEELDPDDLTEYNGYITNRWVSMYSPRLAELINATSNSLWPIFKEDKQFHYQFLHGVLPCVKRKHIQYIKKTKKEDKPKEDERIEYLAKRLELSKREVKYLLDESQHRQTRTPKAPN
jgi:glucan phosphorylase